MKTKKNKQFFLVFVPHRDIRQELEKNTSFFNISNLGGMYTFPRVAPLFSLSKELEIEELKQIALSLREFSGWGKINATQTSITTFPSGSDDMALFGPRHKGTKNTKKNKSFAFFVPLCL
jgi:hypothetical protein